MAQPARFRGDIPKVDRPNPWQRIWSPFWTLPLLIVVLAAVVGTIMPVIDDALAQKLPLVFESGPDGARSVLSTIASAMISVTGLVFSVTMVVLQLASSSYTPRLMSGFLSSRITQATLGVFAASFVYSLIVLRAVRGSNAEGDFFVPQLSVALAMIVVLAAVGMFIAFIHHIVTSIQVGTVLRDIEARTARLIRQQFGEAEEGELGGFGPGWSPRPDEKSFRVTAASQHGRIAHIDFPTLVELAHDHEVVIELERDLGSHVAAGQLLATVWGEVSQDMLRDEAGTKEQREISPDDAFAKRVRRCIGIERDRSMMQDIGFGFRQLLDIADRALSSGVNDPTTAIHAVDEIHSLFRLLATRPTISPYIADGDGLVRVIHRPLSFGLVLDRVTMELAHYGAKDPTMPPRLLAMLDDLAEVARSEYQTAITDARDLVVRLAKDHGTLPAREVTQ
ncbi:MAG: DUF2254 domain-containing protein [bacterium]|nr:DUF2254 domain-containing protein [bacterium]